MSMTRLQTGGSIFPAYTGFANDRMSATVTLRDGGPGDSDGVANGVIIDPGGIGVADNAPASGSAPQSGSGGGRGCFIDTVNDRGMYESMLSAIYLLGFLSLLSLLRIKRIEALLLGLISELTRLITDACSLRSVEQRLYLNVGKSLAFFKKSFSNQPMRDRLPAP